MNDSPYAFRNLWQEITNAIAIVSQTVQQTINDRNVTIRYEEEQYSERTQQGRDAILSRHRGFNTLGLVLALAFVLILAYLLYKKK